MRPPIGKRRRYPTPELTAIHADEREAPAGREPIRWRLLTDLAVDDLPGATGKLDWYAQRFKIEAYHKVLKSGCRAERAGLRTAERLTNLLAVLCVVAWRVFWLTMTSRATPEAPAGVALTSGRSKSWTAWAASRACPRSRRSRTTWWRSRSSVATWRGRRTRRRATWWSGAG